MYDYCKWYLKCIIIHELLRNYGIHKKGYSIVRYILNELFFICDWCYSWQMIFDTYYTKNGHCSVHNISNVFCYIRDW